MRLPSYTSRTDVTHLKFLSDRSWQRRKILDRRTTLTRDDHVSIGFQYQDAVLARLMQKAPVSSARYRALAVLWHIARHLDQESYECSKTGTELAADLGSSRSSISRTLHLLEEAGAIRRIKKGREKVIIVSPDGIFRGDARNRAKLVERYQQAVVENSKADGQT